MHDRCWTALNVSWHDFAASTVTLAKDDNLETQLNGKNTKEPQTRHSAQMRQASVAWGCLDTRFVYKGRGVGAAEFGTIEEWEWMKVSRRSIRSDYLPAIPESKSRRRSVSEVVGKTPWLTSGAAGWAPVAPGPVLQGRQQKHRKDIGKHPNVHTAHPTPKYVRIYKIKYNTKQIKVKCVKKISCNEM